ncbi:LuxR C-terminal-related transcriptional regulator [Nonomuraea rubra]|uniref:LuxR C-terminal-related transcriptional regulator n=1 Tax=Nonomuraea rubra TaxID=46180 RepID=UPI00361FF563
MTGSGHSAQEIADLLRLSRCAVENHRRRIYRKLGVAGQGQAVFRGLGLLEPAGPAHAERAGGRELVVLNARCPIAAEVVTRAVVGAGRALAALRGRWRTRRRCRASGSRRCSWTPYRRTGRFLGGSGRARWPCRRTHRGRAR